MFNKNITMNKNHVGLYIDSQTVCVATAQLVGGAPKIVGHAEIPGPNIFDTNAQNSQRLLEKLKKAFELSGAKTKSVSLVVPPESSMIRHFELPVMPKKDEKNAVRFEAQKYVPFDIKDLYFDHEAHSGGGKKKMSVVFFACKRQWVDQITSLLLLMGVRLDRVELASQSVTRGFRRRMAQPPDQIEGLVLPSDESNAELVFFKGGSVLLTRHLSLMQSSPSDTSFLASELRLSMDYFYENFKNEKVGRLHWVGGAGESSRALGESLSKELSLPVESSDFLRALGNGQPAAIPLAAAYGATLADLLPEKGRQINLRPSDAVSAAPPANWPEEKKRLQELATKEGIGVAVILFLFYLVSINIVSMKNGDLNRAMAAFPKAASVQISQPIAELQAAYEVVNEKARFLTNFVENRPYFTNKMDRLVQMVPRSIRLTSLRYTDNIDGSGKSDLMLRLEGYVQSDTGVELTTVNKFVSQLSEDAEFMAGLGEIRISSTKKTLANEMPVTKFAIDCVTVRKS